MMEGWKMTLNSNVVDVSCSLTYTGRAKSDSAIAPVKRDKFDPSQARWRGLRDALILSLAPPPPVCVPCLPMGENQDVPSIAVVLSSSDSEDFCGIFVCSANGVFAAY